MFHSGSELPPPPNGKKCGQSWPSEAAKKRHAICHKIGVNETESNEDVLRIEKKFAI